MDNKIWKGILAALVIVYIASPVDLAPGPIDDVLVTLLGLAATKKIGGAKHE